MSRDPARVAIRVGVYVVLFILTAYLFGWVLTGMAYLAGIVATSLLAAGFANWLSLRILPYRGPENTIDGAIATLIDIDDLKRARDFAEVVAGLVHEPMLVLGSTLQVRVANEAFYRMFRMDRQKTEGRLIYEIGHGQWNIPRLKQMLEEVLPRETAIKEFEIQHSYEGVGVKTIRLNVREIRQHDGERLILLAIKA